MLPNVLQILHKIEVRILKNFVDKEIFQDIDQDAWTSSIRNAYQPAAHNSAIKADFSC